MKNKITILHVVPTLSLAGTEMFVMNSFSAIDKDRFQFAFLAFSDEYNNLEQKIREIGGTVYYCNLDYNSVYSLYNNIFKLKSILKEIDYDILHCHVSSQCGPVFLASFLAGKKICVAHSHFSSYGKLTGGILRRFIYEKILPSFMFRLGKLFCACSDEAGKALFGENAKYVIVNNAIDTQRFSNYDQGRIDALRAELKIPEGVKVYGNFSRFEKPKNTPFIVDIFNEIQKIEKTSILILAGKKGDLYENTIEKISKYCLSDSVRILGQRADVNILLQLADCIIFPSINEGFGYQAIEAQAASTPVVLSYGIPKSVDLGLGLVKRISLSEGAGYWAEEIMKTKKIVLDKSLIEHTLEEHGLNISTNVKQLETLYASIICND